MVTSIYRYQLSLCNYTEVPLVPYLAYQRDPFHNSYCIHLQFFHDARGTVLILISPKIY